MVVVTHGETWWRQLSFRRASGRRSSGGNSRRAERAGGGGERGPGRCCLMLDYESREGIVQSPIHSLGLGSDAPARLSAREMGEKTGRRLVEEDRHLPGQSRSRPSV